MKRNRIFLAITIGTLLLALIPAAQASTTIRPIDDWLVPELGINPHVLGWGDDTDLAVWPHNIYWDFEPIWNCSYSGYVSERELNDGNLEITIYLKVTDVPFSVTRMGYGRIFVGIMQYTYRLVFTLDVALYAEEFALINYYMELYPDDYIEEGKILYLPLWMYLFGWVESMEMDRQHINGGGTGNFTQPYYDWEAGDSGKMKMHQIAMADMDFKDDHPNYHPEWAIQFWPIEFTFFH